MQQEAFSTLHALLPEDPEQPRQTVDPAECMQVGVEPFPVQGNVQWTAYTYAGELPTSAFGFNSAGLGFTLNAVFPSAIVNPGVARNFVSRQLLAATSFR